MRPIRALLPLLVCGLLAGCLLSSCAPRPGVRVSRDAASGAETFRSQTISVNISPTDGLRLNRQGFNLQAVATCAERPCTPETIDIAFAHFGDTDVSLSYETITLKADGDSFLWENRRDDFDLAQRLPRGEFARVSVPFRMFEQLAQGRDVEVRIGTLPLEIPYNRRQAFRTLLQHMRSQ